MSKELFEKIYTFYDYSVILRNTCIIYEWYFEGEKRQRFFPITVEVNDNSGAPESIVGPDIKIEWKDQFGSSMTFVYWNPGDLKGMFDFIAKGFSLQIPIFVQLSAANDKPQSDRPLPLRDSFNTDEINKSKRRQESIALADYLTKEQKRQAAVFYFHTCDLFDVRWLDTVEIGYIEKHSASLVYTTDIIS